jgi:hypothetical protein
MQEKRLKQRFYCGYPMSPKAVSKESATSSMLASQHDARADVVFAFTVIADWETPDR